MILFVFSFVLLIATMSFAGYFLVRPILSAFEILCSSPNVFPVDLVWFRLSCDHGWIRSGSGKGAVYTVWVFI